MFCRFTENIYFCTVYESITQYNPQRFPEIFRGGDFCTVHSTGNGRFTILTNHIKVLKVFKVVKDTKNLFTMNKLYLLPYLTPQVRAIALSTERGFAANPEKAKTGLISLKKLFHIFTIAAVLFIVGCSKEFDDTEVWNSINSIEQRLSALETVTNAYKNNLFIKSVDNIQNGYVITFSDGSKATIVNGENGKDGDTYIQSITIGENEVTFILTDGQTFSIPLHSALSITFDDKDLIAMQPNSTRKINYKIKSILPDIEIEIISSSDIKAKVVTNDDTKTTGYIEVITGAAIDEYSKVIVFVSNGEKVIMQRFSFEEEGLQVCDNTKKIAAAEGGELTLEFLSNVECKVLIPEDAQSWISVVPATRAMEKQAITLKFEPNMGDYRSSTVNVQSLDNILQIEYQVEQNSINPNDIPNNQIWYTTIDGKIVEPNKANEFGANIVSNTYKNGKGTLTFSGVIKAIEDEAFSQCNNLTSIAIPDSITSIGTNAFCDCSNLTNITIPNSVISIKNSAFYNCRSLINVIIPNNVTSIGNNAFSGCSGLTNIAIPQSITLIDYAAFANCSSLRNITIPENLEYIGEYAFKNTKLEYFYGNKKFVSEDNRCLFGFNPFTNQFDKSYLISFANGSGLTEYTIPNGVSIIEHFVFSANTDIQRITLPNSIQLISGMAVNGCDNLEYIYGDCASADNKCAVIDGELQLFAGKGIKKYITPDNVTSIGGDAFCYKKELEEVVLSDNVTKVGGYGYILEGCANLKTVTISTNMKNLGCDPFGFMDNTCNKLTSVYCRAIIPPSLNTNYPENVNFDNLTIYVPKQSLNSYLNSSDWQPYRKYIVGYEYTDLPEPDYYISSDYSADGTVRTLQRATVGKGIDIILMGDAFSDRQIAAGDYDTAMRQASDNLFTEEPYKSFRDMFNVYAVTAVSATEGYEHENTAFSGYFGGGTLVGGNDAKAFEYAQKAIAAERMDDALIVVMMNSQAYAGTCYMYYPSSNSDYGRGVSVAYFPLGTDNDMFAQLLHHEACGHGFAKLADEYAYEYMGAVPIDYVSQVRNWQSDWGWYKNVDFTSDPTTVKWHTFLSDPRYANDGLGVFEGGATYWTGVWRPTENSIMRYNTGGFNAPSREAIYYRIHKLAYGESWNYDYEDFVAYDAVNRKASAGISFSTPIVPKDFVPLAPPVVVGKSWRDAR